MRRTFVRPALLAAGVLVASLFPSLPAVAAPTIQFLNPSEYTAALRISDKRDADNSYHLVAWAAEVPANPVVEFELATPALALATVTAERVGTDTFEADLNIPDTVQDGQYLLRAILYSGQEDVATTTKTVTVQSTVSPAETVELEYPTVGGPLGFYQPPGGKANAVLEGTTSTSARQVRVFYTLTEAGRAPTWVACGSGRVTGDDKRFVARCTLDDDGPAARVRAVAVVANTTPPPGDPVVAGDETGDAHRVVPYAQVPTVVEFSPQTAKVAQSACTEVTATVEDQSGQQVANVNLDVHAKGPDDQLRFGSILNTTDPFQAPDKGHTGAEPTVKCSAADPDNSQGEHNVPAGPDQKHIETRGGTDNNGSFLFALRSETKGGTLIQAWADIDDDDAQTASEASGGAQLGWGTEPPEPETEILLDPQFVSPSTGSCQKFTVAVKQGGTPLASRNVDIHIKDPEGVAFCAAEGSAARPPDAGEHSGGQHTDGTSHAEGETDSSGTMAFGVTSTREGITNITVWLDEDSDDTQDSGEPTTSGQASWGGQTKRVATSITIAYRSGVWSGKVKSSNAQCRNQRTVFLRKEGRRGDKTVGSDTSSRTGAWKIRKRVKRGRYYAQTPSKQFVDNQGNTIVCKGAHSSTKRR